MTSLETLAKIRKIQIRSRKLVAELLAGAYRSAFKGQGLEFVEVREYQPEDDVRYIDWMITARMGHPFVKVYQEERQLTVMLVVDISPSSRFGTGLRRKHAVMAEIGALLAFSAIENNDKIGLILFSDKVEKYLPPKSGLRHTLRLIRELLTFESTGRGTDIGQALHFLGRVQHKSCICFLLSDFLTSGYEQALKVSTKRFDLIAVRITDPREGLLPKLGLFRVRDLESNETTWVDASSSAVRSRFTGRADTRAKTLEQLMIRLGAGYIPIRTDQPYTQAIQRYFKQRKHRQER